MQKEVTILNKINLLLCLVLIWTLTARIDAAPGDLDPVFGPVGFITTSLSAGTDRAFAAARQTDGKLVLAGTRDFNSVAAIVRYNVNGTLDASFGSGGIVITPISGISQATAVAVQSDGKIVVAATGGSVYAVMRYNANGSLDATFGSGGIFTDSSGGTVNALAILPDGRIVTAGTVAVNFFSADFSIVRLNSNGTFDASFDGDGKVTVNIADQAVGGNDFGYALAIQPDGKIVVGGESEFLNTARDFSLARLNFDGSLDTTFGGSGKVHTAFGGSGQLEAIRSIALQADGRIVAAGLGGENSVRGFALARYNSDGALDTTFDVDGKIITPTSGNGNEAANAVVVQTDGKIVAAGYSILQAALVRYNADGSLDAAFDGDGKVFTSVIGTNQAIARAALLEPNGKIIIAGQAVKRGADEDFLLARYNADGTPSTDFGTFGYVTTNPFDQTNQPSRATGVVVQSDGKIIVGSNRVVSSSQTVGSIIRYTADGRLDSSFASSTSGSGILTINIPGASTNEINSIIVQPNGKIFAAGTYEDQIDIGIFVVAVNADGTRDTTFGGNGNGFALIGSTNGGGLGQDIALQTDGKIVVAGASPNFATQTIEFTAFRFNANGTRDATFGANGIARTAVSAGNDVAFSVIVQPDNKIVLGGTINLGENINSDIALVRFNADGTLDGSFGAGGKVITALSVSTDFVTDIQLQTDGKIVAAGTTCGDLACSSGSAALLRYNPNGSLDNSFDGDGIVITQVPNSLASVLAASVIQTNGKIVAAGTVANAATQTDALVVRYNGDGSVDTTFGAGGFVTSDIGGTEQQAFAVALQTDGKIVTAGYSLNGTREDIAVWRYLGDTASTIRRPGFDFDGDGKADVSVFRPDNGTWYLNRSTAGFTGIAFGIATDKLVPADYDGDGKTDVAVYRAGTWYLQRSQLGFTGISFGDANDIPVPADYDGDGKADLAVFRPSNGTWYLQRSQIGFTGIAFGQNGDKPVAADYDGDGKADLAVNRSGVWYIQRSQLGFVGVTFGDAGDKLVPADYDGDGKADLAVFRPSNGVWYLQRSQLGFTGIAFGVGTDLPAAADYDGDGKADIAVFRNGIWYLQQSANGFQAIPFGASSDKPIPNAFVR